MMQKLFKTKHEVVSRKTDEIATHFLENLSLLSNDKFSHQLKKSKLSLEDVITKDSTMEKQHYNTWACYFGTIDRQGAEELLSRSLKCKYLFLQIDYFH